MFGRTSLGNSKAIYGAILSYIACKRSEALDFEPAIATSRR
ncbi:hypothetical protein [Pseudanabaena sp. FACHB-2040]|nr:hypothetical protein [Pseudanabaena sp. FACHB-2040]